MPQRLDLGRALLAAGGILLAAALFVRWYDVDASGWEVFETLDLVLAGAAGAAVALALRPSQAQAQAALALPIAVVGIVFVQIVNPPPAAAGADPATGAWLALAAGLLMLAGTALSLAAVSVTVQVRGREVRRRVPAVDHREDAPTAGPAAGAAPSLFAEPEEAQPAGGEDSLGKPTQEFGAIAPEDPDPEDASRREQP